MFGLHKVGSAVQQVGAPEVHYVYRMCEESVGEEILWREQGDHCHSEWTAGRRRLAHSGNTFFPL